MQARISDNVLEDREWTVVELVIQEGLVVSQHEVQQGAYSLDLVGRDFDDLARWTQHDDTGVHPENYHELNDGSGWRSFWTAPELRRALKREGRRS